MHLNLLYQPLNPKLVLPQECVHMVVVHSIISCPNLCPSIQYNERATFQHISVSFSWWEFQIHCGLEWSILIDYVCCPYSRLHKICVSGLPEPSRHLAPFPTFVPWQSTKTVKGGVALWSLLPTDDTSVGNGFLNLGLGCKSTDEVSNEASFSMLWFIGLGTMEIAGNCNVAP